MEEHASRELARRLKEARIAARMTQQDVAVAVRATRAVGMTRQAVSAWERGESQPTLPQLVAVCHLYGASADYLLFGVRSKREYQHPILRQIFAQPGAPDGAIRPPAASASS